jgi:hypothetical protein
MHSTIGLVRLLVEPNETLSAEYKSWLNLSVTQGQGVLAKAAIALANHGGGIIVLGMREQEAGPLKSVARPSEIGRYTQDDVNQAINRFAEPEFHCDLSFATGPGTTVEHAFVSVPGNIAVPVMSTRDCTGVIAARRCYIRKPGPRSEEPLDAREWRALLDRCVVAGRENMLDAIRAIVQGSAGSVPQPTVTGKALTDFTEATRTRWTGRVASLPKDDPARFPLGHYELGFEILGANPLPNLSEMRRAMQQAGSIKHTGWGPFVQLHRPEYEPHVVGGAIETWLGAPAERAFGRDSAHCDFWRADASGKLILFRGYDEDSIPDRQSPGTGFDITLPVWRVGEAVLYVSQLAELFGDGLSFLVRCRYVGLRGRRLIHVEGRRILFDDRRAADDEVSLERVTTCAQARDNLVEVLHPLLAPLYERFAFFELSEKLVAEEVERLTRNRF